MVRRNRRSLLRFEAVAAALLLALPMLPALADEVEPYADEIEPEPYVEEEAAEPAAEAEEEAAESVAETEETQQAESEAAKQPERSIEPVLDLLLIRPAGLVATIVGGVFFMPVALLAAPSGPQNIRAAWEHFVIPPVERTFYTPLGAYY